MTVRPSVVSFVALLVVLVAISAGAAACTGSSGSPTPAQPVPAADPAPGVPAFHVEAVGRDLYALIYPETNGAIVSGNSLVVIGDAGVLVVDSSHFPTRARQMIEQIRRWTDRPVRWLINTHWHPDHNAGNGVFLRAFPGLEIISTTATRDDIVELLPKKELTPAQIDGFLADTRRGTDAAGKPFSEAERRYRAKVAAELVGFGPELRAAEHSAPNATFTGERVIDVGHRVVRVAFLGRGNTAGDAIVQVPDARLVATGDLVVHPVPYPFGSFIGEWIATLGRLRAIDAATLVPGHGPVMHDPGFLDLTIELLRETRAQVDATVAAGKSLDETLAGVRLDALRARFVGDDPDRAGFFDHGYLPTAVRRAYREAASGPLHDQD